MTKNDSIVLQAMKDFEEVETNAEKAACVRFLATRLAAADVLFAASKDAAKFVAKYVADTESVIGERALDRLEKAMREYEEAKNV